jgi:phosphoribosylglycinamide formyltransferase 1
MPEKLRLAIFISGSGTTMEAIGYACQENDPLYGRIEPVLVIASRSDAGGIPKAENLGIPIQIVERKSFENGQLFGEKLLSYLYQYNVEYINQNGWLPFTPKNVVECFKNKIFNQHPGPTEFGGKGMHGLAVHAAVLEFQRLTGRKFPTEAVIHKVTNVVDGGAVVARREVQIYPGDTPELLRDRVIKVEHALQIDFLNQLSQGIITELYREKPLVHKGEEQKLIQAIQYGVIYAQNASLKT